MIYLAYVTSGKEFEASDALTFEGFDVWCGRTVEFIRRGKRRRAEAIEQPKLPNYIFLSLEDDEWQRLQTTNIKYLAKTMHTVGKRDARNLQRFKDRVDVEYAEARRIADSNDRAEISEYVKGQKLVDIKETFGDAVLRFRGMIERAHDAHPVIVADMEMMGQTVTAEFDPLDIKAQE